jgi:phosphoribosylformylglycinamidine cyclo-ligase
MPGFYPVDEYDLAGFAVGIVDKPKIIDGKKIKAGDKLIGLPSSGVHSNGFSLVRKLIKPTEESLTEYVQKLGCTFGEELIRPTKIYVKTILNLIEKFEIKGLSHITGGGFIENIPRMIPEGLKV